MVVKILICLNCILKPKVIAIYDSNNLSSTDLYTLFGKLHEHEMDLKRLDDDEEGDKNKRKSISLKVTNIRDMKSEDEDC